MAKKILFSDKYGLTQSVLEGRKTMTRRMVPLSLYNQTDWKAVEEGGYEAVVDGEGYYHDIRRCGNYQIGEVVAVAQAYKEIVVKRCFPKNSFSDVFLPNTAGWKNKMFVRADLMPYRIRISDIKVERLQDISDEDCLREGILQSVDGMDMYTFDGWSKRHKGGIFPVQVYSKDPREAFAALIDRISGKGTWERNPWCFAYSFELIK